jgi:hypothetical protein
MSPGAWSVWGKLKIRVYAARGINTYLQLTPVSIPRSESVERHSNSVQLGRTVAYVSVITVERAIRGCTRALMWADPACCWSQRRG